MIDILDSQLFSKELLPDNNRLIMESPQAQRVVLLNKEFNTYIANKWFTPNQKIHAAEYPSTGFLTIIIALHLCDTVDLFGFGPDAKGRWWHYFDMYRILMGHRTDFQSLFITTLSNRKIVRNYKGNMYPSVPFWDSKIGKNLQESLPKMPVPKDISTSNSTLSP